MQDTVIFKVLSLPCSIRMFSISLLKIKDIFFTSAKEVMFLAFVGLSVSRITQKVVDEF